MAGSWKSRRKVPSDLAENSNLMSTWASKPLSSFAIFSSQASVLFRWVMYIWRDWLCEQMFVTITLQRLADRLFIRLNALMMAKPVSPVMSLMTW
jgi:hypothetical protein